MMYIGMKNVIYDVVYAVVYMMTRYHDGTGSNPMVKCLGHPLMLINYLGMDTGMDVE